MPLYQSKGNDGYFLIRKIPGWTMKLSAIVRKWKLDRILIILPGVKWAKMEIESSKGVGSKRLAQLNSNKYYEEMIAYEKEYKWGFTMLESNSGMLRTITEVIYLKKIDNSTTQVYVKGGYETRGLANLMKGMVLKTVRKTWEEALASLKIYTEEL